MHSECKVCKGLRNIAWRQKNAAKVAEYARGYTDDNRDAINRNNDRYREKHPIRIMLRLAKTRAQNQNVPYNLTVEDIIIPDVCPLLKVPFVKHTRYAASIDRIDPKKGYVVGNIVIISLMANQMKSSASFLEICAFCENAPKFYLPLLNAS